MRERDRLRYAYAPRLAGNRLVAADPRVLVGAGLVTPKRIKGWTMYKRDEKAISAAKKAIRDRI